MALRIFIRPIQCIYPLEIKAKEMKSSGGMLRSNDFKGETKYDDQSSLHEKIIENKLTSYGPIIKIPVT